jgi:hypothetical protein
MMIRTFSKTVGGANLLVREGWLITIMTLRLYCTPWDTSVVLYTLETKYQSPLEKSRISETERIETVKKLSIRFFDIKSL